MNFLSELHIKYIVSLTQTPKQPSPEYFLTSHLRLPGAYWSLTALHTLNAQSQLSPQQIQDLKNFIIKCQNSDGGFGGNISHDSHITSTHYAILVFILLDSISELNLEIIIKYIKNLQQEDGSFRGDSQSLDCDTRFSYCAFSALYLLGALEDIDIEKGVEYVKRCRNVDGGLGGMPEMESHAAYAFCGAGVLKIVDEFNQNIKKTKKLNNQNQENTNESLEKVEKNTKECLDGLEGWDLDSLAGWLSERQLQNGGFNGRPDKLADVCYSWWILSTLFMMKKQAWISGKNLENYILTCQDEEGGIADKPGNQVDVFHTFFGLAALSLLDEENVYQLNVIDPTFALPVTIVKKHVEKK